MKSVAPLATAPRRVLSWPSGWIRRLEICHEPIYWAAQSGDIAVIDYFRGLDANLATQCQRPGCNASLLGQAAKNGQADAMKHLVALGLLIDCREETKDSRGGRDRTYVMPVRLAAINNQRLCISYILDAWENNQMRFEGKEYVHNIALIATGIVRPPLAVEHDTIHCALFLL